MRLTCEAHINLHKSGGSVRKLGASTLCIRANVRDRKLYNLVISTRKQTECACYKNLRTNIVKLFTSCVREGKMTISFREPLHDLLISKAPVPLLERFLSVLRAIEKGEEIPTRFLKEAKMEEPPPRTMKITERSQYPVRGFPASLEKLYINNIKLSRIQKNVIDLANLVELCLDDNALKTIPADISSMSLKCLSLARNELTELNDIFLGTLGKTIKELDLSKNRIRRVSYSIVRPKFRKLDLSDNDLTELPESFKGGDELALLRLEGNPIDHISSSFLAKNAKVSMTTLLAKKYERPPDVPKFPSLVELSCARLNQIGSAAEEPFEEFLPRRLHAYLLSFVKCLICGKFIYPYRSRRYMEVFEYLEAMNSLTVTQGRTTTGYRSVHICLEKSCRNRLLDLWRLGLAI